MCDGTDHRSAGAPVDRWTNVLGGFFRIGLTAFGGGSATISAMRRLVLRKQWLSEPGFMETLMLSRLCPGISILAQAILIGRRVAGVRGIVAALTGLLVPSVGITLALAELYDLILRSQSAGGPLRGVSAAAAGFSVALAIQTSREYSRRIRLLSGVPVLGGLLAAAFLTSNAPLVLGISLLVGASLPRLFTNGEH